VREALILAGGVGSRLGELTADLPKPLIDVGGVPFIDTLLWNVRRHGIQRIVFSLGVHADRFVEHLDSLSWPEVEIICRVEPEPLGTGGALAFAGAALADDEFLLLNGDTLFDFNYLDLALQRREQRVPAALALREVHDAGRYGAVVLAEESVVGFSEKSSEGSGLVNGGVLALSRSVIDRLPAGASSLERDLMPTLIAEGLVVGRRYEGYFVDIGTPHSLTAARAGLPKWRRKPAVFLDRDGVLNVDRGHVHTPDEFEWMPKAIEAVKWLNDRGFLVFAVTNQAGIAKGYYSEGDYVAFERWISDRLAERGAHVDATYHCPHHPEGRGEYGQVCGCRKPAPGMLLQAIADWELDTRRTVLLGDKESDLAAAAAAGVPGFLVAPDEDILDATRRVIAQILK
jgi:D,D-heptose 1,7-bisphosphate phosphatase